MCATMQVAYYRMRGRFDSTYESAMTKHFLGGRTETIRPVTAESCALARAWVCALLHAGAYVGSLSCPHTTFCCLSTMQCACVRFCTHASARAQPLPYIGNG
jgi:hypothetical protein